MLGGELQGESEHSQAADDPKGKAVDKNVHLRHGPAEDGKYRVTTNETASTGAAI